MIELSDINALWLLCTCFMMWDLCFCMYFYENAWFEGIVNHFAKRKKTLLVNMP